MLTVQPEDSVSDLRSCRKTAAADAGNTINKLVLVGGGLIGRESEVPLIRLRVGKIGPRRCWFFKIQPEPVQMTEKNSRLRERRNGYEPEYQRG